jgi:two-component system sensor histidine kinase QseC
MMFSISSIKRFLLVAVISLITVAWLLTAIFNFRASREQVEELFDAELAQMSRILQSVMSNHIRTSSAVFSPSLNYLDKELLLETFGHQEFNERGHKYEKKLAFQVWDAKGELFFENSSDLPKRFDSLQAGYQDINDGKPGWRTFTLQDPDFGFWVKVAQREDVRTELTGQIALSTMLPNLLLMPVLIILIAWLIRKGLDPLTQISHALKERDYQNLDAINAQDYPVELAYLVDELNDLFQRVSEASERERRFTADAAHELRTPLSISKVHLQNILQVSDSAQIKEFVRKALAGIDRLIHMVQQLLILSRLDAQQEQEALRPVALYPLARDLAAELQAHQSLTDKQIVIRHQDDCVWVARETQMRILLRNLLDNAFRYAHPNTQIELDLTEHEIVLFNVCDVMSDEQITRNQERFKRGNSAQQGSGLGLSICAQICQQNNYSFSMKNRNDHLTGIEIRVVRR